MSGHSQESPFASSFRASSVVLVLIFIACLSIFVSPLMIAVPLAGLTFLWVVFYRPVFTLGAVLAFMPVDYIAIELGKFFGLPYMTLVSACTKEIPLLLLTFVLWKRNGFKPVTPDWFLLTFASLATSYTLFGGSWASLAFDLNFIIPYFVGRMTVLGQEQEQRWARRAVWIVGVLSVLGLSEVFIFGEGPRTLLYASTDAMMNDGALTASFHAVGFGGLREASTMAGPPSFGPLCMIALIVWWVYCRSPLVAGMITVGLVCSLTRSAWVGTAVAIPVLAFLMNQRRRFFLYGGLALALFAASVPILGLSDYLFFTKTGQDPSAAGHEAEIVSGLNYAIEHPLGSGNARFSRIGSLQGDSNKTIFETTYPTIAASYGMPAVVCFFGCLFSAMIMVWRQKSNLSYAAVGILIGIAIVMAVALPFDDRRLACWAWFPVGLAIRSSISRPLLPRSERLDT